MWIIVTGDMSSGFAFHGPFETVDSANQYATQEGFGVWEVCEVITPEYLP